MAEPLQSYAEYAEFGASMVRQFGADLPAYKNAIRQMPLPKTFAEEQRYERAVLQTAIDTVHQQLSVAANRPITDVFSLSKTEDVYITDKFENEYLKMNKEALQTMAEVGWNQVLQGFTAREQNVGTDAGFRSFLTDYCTINAELFLALTFDKATGKPKFSDFQIAEQSRAEIDDYTYELAERLARTELPKGLLHKDFTDMLQEYLMESFNQKAKSADFSLEAYADGNQIYLNGKPYSLENNLMHSVSKEMQKSFGREIE